MKSLTRLLAIFGILFCIALSCPANATNTEETKTTVDVANGDFTLEVADFSNTVEVGLDSDPFKNNTVKKAVLTDTLKIDVYVFYGGNVKTIISQEFTKIKRFPNPRDAVNYFV